MQRALNTILMRGHSDDEEPAEDLRQAKLAELLDRLPVQGNLAQPVDNPPKEHLMNISVVA